MAWNQGACSNQESQTAQSTILLWYGRYQKIRLKYIHSLIRSNVFYCCISNSGYQAVACNYGPFFFSRSKPAHFCPILFLVEFLRRTLSGTHNSQKRHEQSETRSGSPDSLIRGWYRHKSKPPNNDNNNNKQQQKKNKKNKNEKNKKKNALDSPDLTDRASNRILYSK